MSKVKTNNYICISAMLHAREAKMLTREKLERVLTESSFADSARALLDAGYPDMSAMDTSQIYAALEKFRAEQVEEVSELIPDQSVVDVFRLKYEYHNAKVLVKSTGTNTALFSDSGRTGYDELLTAYRTDEDVESSPILGPALAEAKLTLARTGNPQAADFILDRAYFAELTALAKEIGDDFISGYVRLLIDSANLRAAVRAINMGKHELLSECLVNGGSEDAAAVMAAGESRESLAALYGAGDLSAALEARDMTEFEKRLDNAVNAYLAETERMSFGPAVVLGYLAAVENEVMSVRIVLTGKLMGIDANLLRERLRDSYV